MDNTPTPHIAAKKGEIAKMVMMSGDPLRAKYVADNFLENPVLYNQVRNIFGYTGTYNGKRVSVQGHGMGIPSIGIYSYELFTFYDVDIIVRFGTCGSADPNVKVGSIIIADSALSDSNFGYQYHLPEDYVPRADPELLEKATENAKAMGIDFQRGPVFSSDVFYTESNEVPGWVKQGALGVEMEAHALYINAFVKGKKALTILTVSDNLVTGEELTAEQRQKGLSDSIKLALSLIPDEE